MQVTHPETTGTKVPRFGRIDIGLDVVREGIRKSTDWLFSQQHADGYWYGELEADVMLEADYIYMHTLLGTGDPGKMERCVNEILRHQNEDGGWSLYPGGPSNINYGVKSYHALKLMGWDQNDPVLVRARTWILANGGVVECNTFTKIYLCAFGQYDYDAVPAIPPEIILFPNWFYFNIYEISIVVAQRSWCRCRFTYAKKPFKKLAPEQGIDELFVGGRAGEKARPAASLRPQEAGERGEISFCSATDRLIHLVRSGYISGRIATSVALKKAEKLDARARLEMSDGLGAIYPAMLNSISCACDISGYSLDDPQVIRAMDEFEKLGIDEPEGDGRLSGADFSDAALLSRPVWDTAQAVFARLGDGGCSDRNDPRAC